MMITVCPFSTFVPFEKHCLRRVPATGAFTSAPPTATGAETAAGAAPAGPNATLYAVPFTFTLIVSPAGPVVTL